MAALPKRASCPAARSSPSRAAASSRARTLSFISWAALSVKVTTSSRSMSTGRSGSRSRRTIRSTSTDVFPAPAAAETRMSLPRTVMACSWLSVQALPAGVSACLLCIGRLTSLRHPLPRLLLRIGGQVPVPVPGKRAVKLADGKVHAELARPPALHLIGLGLGLAPGDGLGQLAGAPDRVVQEAFQRSRIGHAGLLGQPPVLLKDERHQLGGVLRAAVHPARHHAVVHDEARRFQLAPPLPLRVFRRVLGGD